MTDIPLTFSPEEEDTSIFLLQDLIKEYNRKALSSPPYRKKYPLSLKAFDAKNPIIRPMTTQEIEAMKPWELHVHEFIVE